MVIKVFFEELESPRDLVFEAADKLEGSHELDKENEWVTLSFPYNHKNMGTACMIIDKHIQVKS